MLELTRVGETGDGRGREICDRQCPCAVDVASERRKETLQAASFRPEGADIVRRVVAVGPCRRRVEDVSGGVVVEYRPDVDSGGTGRTSRETEHTNGIAAGKALTCVGCAGGIVLVLNQRDRVTPMEQLT